MDDRDRFDNFTKRARKVLSLAQEEAQRLNHNYIGTEHLLLGLVREGEGVAAHVLKDLDIELNKVRSAVEFIIGRRDRIVLGEIGLTPRSKKVIELAVDEARRLNHYHIDTEHLLLGLMREGEGIAAGVLESLGAILEAIRLETVSILGTHSDFLSQEAITYALLEATKKLETLPREKEGAVQQQNNVEVNVLSRQEITLQKSIARFKAKGYTEVTSGQLATSKEDSTLAAVPPVPSAPARESVVPPPQTPAAPTASPPVRSGAFISYSHRDKEHLERLRVHLRYYERAGTLNIWDDTRITVGSKWREEIKRAIASARVAILLISADFLASDFIAENELPPLLAAAQEEGAVIIPIILKHCAFEDSELGQFQAVEQAQSLIDLSEGRREEVWTKVARLVKEALKTAEAHANRADSL